MRMRTPRKPKIGPASVGNRTGSAGSGKTRQGNTTEPLGT